jgi:hypothetical protein
LHLPFFFLLYFTLQYWSGLSTLEVLQAAREKLFFNKDFDPKNEKHVFAALAVRVGLEIGEGEASSRLARKTVSSHMRILTGAVGPLIVTTSPSEPLLAIAAATALNTSSDTYQDAIETLLDKLILPGLILDRGELYSRLLLMLARDKATVRGDCSFVMPDPISREPTVRAVELSKFLQILLGPKLGISDNNQAILRTKLLEATSNV